MEASHQPDKSPENIIIDSLTAAIMAEDYEYFDAIVRNQNVVDDPSIAEYMQIKRRGTDDPVEADRWESGLSYFLEAIDGKLYSKDDLERLDAVVNNLEFDAIVTNTEVGEEPTVLGVRPFNPEEAIIDPAHWSQSVFLAEYSESDLEALRMLPVFNNAEKDAREGMLQRAVRTALQLQGERGILARQAIDTYVFQAAEQHAQSGAFARAMHYVREYGSSEDAQLPMHRALDKHVFEKAQSYVLGGVFHEAQKVIAEFVSTPSRRDMMLRELGLV